MVCSLGSPNTQRSVSCSEGSAEVTRETSFFSRLTGAVLVAMLSPKTVLETHILKCWIQDSALLYSNVIPTACRSIFIDGFFQEVQILL